VWLSCGTIVVFVDLDVMWKYVIVLSRISAFCVLYFSEYFIIQNIVGLYIYRNMAGLSSDGHILCIGPK
jgi:hypothetical protein